MATTTRIYTAVQRITNSQGGASYAQVGPDLAFTSNKKNTTAKRAVGDGLTNWYFTVNGSVKSGDKVFVVLLKVMTGSSRTLLWPPIPAKGFRTKKEAQAYRRTLGGKQAGFVIYSFDVDQRPAPTTSPAAAITTPQTGPQVVNGHPIQSDPNRSGNHIITVVVHAGDIEGAYQYVRRNFNIDHSRIVKPAAVATANDPNLSR